MENRGVAQLASASGLGPEGPVFESRYPDNATLDVAQLVAHLVRDQEVEGSSPFIQTRKSPTRKSRALYLFFLRCAGCPRRTCQKNAPWMAGPLQIHPTCHKNAGKMAGPLFLLR